jgi:hypothetical protein
MTGKKAEGLRGRTDYENFDSLMDADTEEINAYIEKIKDPDVKRAVTMGAQSIISQYRNTVRVKKTSAIVEVGKATLSRNLQDDTQDWILSAGPLREQKKDQMEARIIASASAGILTPTEAEKMIQGLDTGLEEAYAAELMNTNPKRLKEELEGGKLTNIDPEKRQALIARAKPKIEEGETTSVYMKVMAEAGGKPEKAQAIISSPDAIKKYGITIETKDKVLASIERDRVVTERAYEAFAKEKVGELSNKIYKNLDVTDSEMEGLRGPDKATVERIRDYQIRQNRAELREKAAEARRERAEDRQRRLDERIAKQDKSAAIAGEILAKINENEPIDVRKDIYARIPDGLMWDDVTRLTSAMSKVQKDPRYILGFEVLKNAKRDRIIDAATYGKLQLEFRETVARDELHGNEIIDLAERLINPQKENAIKAWLNNLFSSMPSDTQPTDFTELNMIGPPTQESAESAPVKSAETVVKTVTIDGKEYKDGDEIVKDGKRYRVRVR